MDFVEFVMMVEDEFQLQVPDEDGVDLLTGAQWCDYLSKNLNVPQSEIWPRVRTLIARLMGILEDQITPDQHFVKDLEFT